MKSIGRRIIDDAPRNTYFAAVNSGKGFVSYFSEVFGNGKIKRRYIIKGGPGTGKSSFMRKAAEYAEERGRDVKYFRCSSDPDSLDGITVDGSIAMLDGTSPHVYEPRLVGVEDEIINLGQFWDADRLYIRYNDIVALSALKSEAYARAYRFLSAAMSVSEVNSSLTESAVNKEKAQAAARRILRQIKNGEGFELCYGFVNAIGMDGLSHITSLEKTAKKLYFIFDHYGLGWHFLEAVIKGAVEKGLKTQVSYSPLEPHKPDGVYFPDGGIAFVVSDGDAPALAANVNMNRFIDSDILDRVKSEYRQNSRLREALLSSAVDALSEAGRYHFELEEIYSSCMDFSAESIYAEEFCRKHLK